MNSLPPGVAEQVQALFEPGEKVKKSAPAGSAWVILTDRALYAGDPLQRFSREDITGIEIDRVGTGPGAMFLLSGTEPLCRIDFGGVDRAGLISIERALAPRRKRVRVLLDQSDYAPGETIRGTVELDWPKAAPVRGIRVGLVGTETTEITESTGMGDDRRSWTSTEQDPQIAEEWILFGGDRIGWFQAAQEAVTALFSAGAHPLLPAGRHRFPFEIALPPDALPCYAGKYASVTYRIHAVVDIPLGFDYTFEGVLTVVDPREAAVVPRTYTSDETAQGLLKPVTADLRMGLQIAKGPYFYGEQMQLRLRVENRSRKRIRSASITLCAVEYARAGGTNRETRSDLETVTIKFPDPGAESQDYRFEIPVPAWPIPFSGRFSQVDMWFIATLDIARAFDSSISVPLELTW